MTLLRVQGAGALALPRAVEGVVHLALFVDAGWRDATPPQLATATAGLAAARSPGVVARVEPDLTEWSITCARPLLERCVGQLAGVLALRSTEDTEAFAARQAIVDARRLALTDERRTTDALAFAALWTMPQANAFGDVVDDDALDSAAIAGFAAGHYGPSRALFVAAGDVDASALQDALARALSNAPRSTVSRRDASPAREENAAVRVRVGETDAVSVALLVHDAGLARAIAARIEAESTSEDEYVAAFALRGGGAVLLRPAGVRSEVGALAGQAVDAVARLSTARREVSRARVVETPDALDALARAHGRAFATGDAWPSTSDEAPSARSGDAMGRIGVGVMVRGTRQRPLRNTDPDIARARETETRVHNAVEETRRALSSAEDVSGEEVTLSNGARLSAQRTAGTTTRALAVRFAVDHGAEPPALHGRAALAAEALGMTCRERAARLGVTLHPRTSRGWFGLLMTGSSDQALLALLACALHASPGEAVIDEARRRRVDALSPVAAPEHHARLLAARALTPSTPALLAPEGSAEGVAAVPDGEVHALLATSRRGARVRVSWAGDAAPPSAALARRLATLPPGAPPSATVHGEASVDQVLAAAWRGRGPRATVALRTAVPVAITSAELAERSARALAHALATRLGDAPGLRAIAADGAVLDAGVVTAWVSLDLDETALEALPSTLQRDLAALARTSAGRDAIAEAYARGDAARATALALPGVVADRRVLERVPARATTSQPLELPLVEVVDALAAAPWRVVVARPSRPAR